MPKLLIPALTAVALWIGLGTGNIASAWTQDPPTLANQQPGSARSEAVNLGRESEARITEEFDGFRRLSARVLIEIPSGKTGRVYVFDADGLLQEIVPTAEVTGGSFWTDMVEGAALTLSLVLPGQEQAEIAIEQVVGERAGGMLDGAPDGRFDLDLVEANSSGFWSDARHAIAALSIGRNPEPFPAETRPERSVPCTGFMVSNDLMMTAAHCFAGQSSLCRQTVAVFGFEVDGHGTRARKCEAVVYINGALDVAVLKLTAAGGPVATVSLQPAAPDVSNAVVIQHPRGSVKMVSLTNCRILRQPAPTIWRRARDQRADLLDAGFEHSCDTESGTSGAPVLAPDGLVGVHQGSVPAQNIGVRTQRILDCVAIDPVAQTVTVVSPGETMCINEAPQ